MTEKTAAEQIDDIIHQYGGWKTETLARIREIIMAADSNIDEQVKWKMPSRPEGLPVWYHGKMLCLVETFKDNIKLVFVKGAQMDDLQKHFNARLKSSTDRAIEFHEEDSVDEAVITILVHEAVRINTAQGSNK